MFRHLDSRYLKAYRLDNTVVVLAQMLFTNTAFVQTNHQRIKLAGMVLTVYDICRAYHICSDVHVMTKVLLDLKFSGLRAPFHYCALYRNFRFLVSDCYYRNTTCFVSRVLAAKSFLCFSFRLRLSEWIRLLLIQRKQKSMWKRATCAFSQSDHVLTSTGGFGQWDI